jgi:hypothetical protein
VINDPKEIRRSFVAERRSLLITAFALFFYQAAGLRITSINLFGNTVALSDPWWISFGLWTLWIYLLLRYLQYFMVTLDTGFSDAYQEWMKRIIRRSAFGQFKKSFVPDEDHAGFRHSFRIRETNFPLTYPQFWSVKLEISVAYTKKEVGATATSTIYDHDVRSWRLCWVKVKAVTSTVLLTHVATEYVLPFIVALFPVGAFLYLLWK